VELSASVRENRMTVTLVNLSAEKAADIDIEVPDALPVSASGRVLAGRPCDHNTFDDPDKVHSVPLEGIKTHGHTLSVQLPPCAVAALDIALA